MYSTSQSIAKGMAVTVYMYIYRSMFKHFWADIIIIYIYIFAITLKFVRAYGGLVEIASLHTDCNL